MAIKRRFTVVEGYRRTAAAWQNRSRDRTRLPRIRRRPVLPPRESVVTRTIGLLLMDDLPDHAQGPWGDYPELFAHLLRDTGVRLLDIAVHRGEVPASLDDADTWLLTGSRHSVYDDLPWVATALELTRSLLAEERATVGICFGHQLLAQVLGGRVGPAGRWGIGLQTYESVDPLHWFDEPALPIALIASHRDQVLAVPSDATVWSTSAYCPVAGLAIGDRAWSVQAHPELTPAVAHALYDGRRALIGDAQIDAATASLRAPNSNADVGRAIARFTLASS
jgi:GMP synthase-like glutamine amidotransferase